MPLIGFGDPRAPAVPPTIGGDGATLFTNSGGVILPAAPGARQPAMFAAGGGTGGVLLAPSFFRGRVFALDFQLRLQRSILAASDPYLNQNPAFKTQFKDEDIYGDPHNQTGPPADSPTGSRPREQSPPSADSD